MYQLTEREDVTKGIAQQEHSNLNISGNLGTPYSIMQAVPLRLSLVYISVMGLTSLGQKHNLEAATLKHVLLHFTSYTNRKGS